MASKKKKAEEIKELTPEEQHQQDLERLEKLRPMDDTFMRELFRNDKKLAQFVLRIITGIKDLKLTSEETQYDLQHLFGARSICLDVFAVDKLGRIYNLEVQRADSGASLQRVRYHAGALAVELLPTNQDFSELPITYVIFITENDVRGKGLPLHHIARYDYTAGEPVDDGEHIIFVNGAYQNKSDKSKLAKLIHDFNCSDPDEMYLPKIAEKTRYYKRTPEGVSRMCKLMEDMRNETTMREKIQTALRMLAKGKYSLEEIAEISELSLRDVQELADKHNFVTA